MQPREGISRTAARLVLLGLGAVAARAAGTSAGLDAAITRMLTDEGVPAAAWALVGTTGTEHVGCFGKAGDGAPVGPDTRFRASSISKTFLALAAARLAEAGKLGLDADVERLAPELGIVNPWKRERGIRVADLLEHSSGLPDFHFPEIFEPDGREDVPVGDLLLAHPQWMRARWRPGSRQGYSNRGYTVLAYLLEKAAGQPFEEVLARQVFEPLGMRSARFRLSPGERACLAAGVIDGSGVPVAYRPAWFRPAANLAVSVADLAAAEHMLLVKGRTGKDPFLSAPMVVRLETPEATLAAEAGMRVGTGSGLGTRCSGGRPWVGHYGGGYAYRAEMRYLEDLGRGYVILMSSSFHVKAWNELQRLVREAIVPPGPAAAPPPGPATPEADAGDPARVAGWYQVANIRHQLFEPWALLWGTARVVARGRGLTAESLEQDAEELVPVGPGRYALARDRCTELVFAQDAEGRDVLAGDAVYLERLAWPWPLALGAFLVLCLLVSVLAGIRGLGRLLLGRSGAVVGALAALPGLCFLASLGTAMSLPPHELGVDSPAARLVWAASWAFGAAPWLGLWAGLRRRDRWLVVGSLGAGAVAAFCAWGGYVGIRLWAD